MDNEALKLGWSRSFAILLHTLRMPAHCGYNATDCGDHCNPLKILVKDGEGRVIGFERLNYLSAKQRQRRREHPSRSPHGLEVNVYQLFERKALHPRLEPAAATQFEPDPLPHSESAAHVEFKATGKTAIESSDRPRLSESRRSRCAAGVGPEPLASSSTYSKRRERKGRRC